MERKIRKIKKAIRKEIAVEVRALKILAPLFGQILLVFTLLCIFWAENNVLHNLVHLVHMIF